MATKKNDAEVAVAAAPDEQRLVQQADELDFYSDAGDGLGGFGANDLAVPFISIIQRGSPQIDENNPKYITGSKVGMFFNTVTQKLYQGDVGIRGIPCGYTSSMVEWKSRDSGGGLVGHHSEGDPIFKKTTKNERGQFVTEEGNVIIDTAYYFFLLLPNEPEQLPEWSILSFSGSQRKKSRVWNAVMTKTMRRHPSTGKMFVAPMYSNIFTLTTTLERKDNYNWYGYAISSAEPVTDPAIYQLAKQFNAAIKEGRISISAQRLEQDPETDSKEEVPF